MIEAKVIADSVVDKGGDTPLNRLITLEVNFHRFILAEVNTHRCASRGYQSTRAVPTIKMIEQVRDNPAVPVKFAKNQAGMVAGETLVGEDYERALGVWLKSSKEAADNAEELLKIGVHKEIAGRILEPFIWTKGIITATKAGWDSMLKLRLHKDAQPEFRALAQKIKEAIDNSTPNRLQYGEWHLPYYSGNESIINAIKISTSCCAQVSYRALDDSLEKAKKIYDMLNLPENGVYKDDPSHMSPCEHQAMCLDEKEFVGTHPSDIGGNFQTCSWWQYRKILENGAESCIEQ